MTTDTLTITLTKEQFFLITESLRLTSEALARHPEATQETEAVRGDVIHLGALMLNKARMEKKEW